MSHDSRPVAAHKSLSAMLRNLDRQECGLLPALAPDPWRPLEPNSLALAPIFAPDDDRAAAAQRSARGPSGLVRRADRLGLGLGPHNALAFVSGLLAPGTICLLAGALSIPSVPPARWAHANLAEFKIAEAQIGTADVIPSSMQDAPGPQGALAKVLAILRAEATMSAEAMTANAANPERPEPPVQAASLDAYPAIEDKPRVIPVHTISIERSQTFAVATTPPAEFQAATPEPRMQPAPVPPAQPRAAPGVQRDEAKVPAAPPTESRPERRPASRDTTRDVRKAAKAKPAASPSAKNNPAKKATKTGTSPAVKVASARPLPGEARLGATGVRSTKRTPAAPPGPARRPQAEAPAEPVDRPAPSSSFLGRLFGF